MFRSDRPRPAADAGDTTTDVLGEIRDLIDASAIDLLTCDVFDTLVWRPVAEPRHLFVELGRRLREAGLIADFVEPIDVARGREDAERRARERNRRDRGSTECTLEEIWALMPRRWSERTQQGTDVAAWRAEGRDVELALEGELLRLHPPVAELLVTAHRAGVETVLVSDTYLSEAQLRILLERAGAPLDAIGRIVVSSERDLAKYAGLLRDVVEESGYPPGRTAHLGDHPVADVRAAQELGASAFAAAVEPDHVAAPAVLDELAIRSAADGDDRGVTASAAALMIEPTVRGRADAEFGITVGGPLMYGFAGWASRTAEDLGVEVMHCLMREGGFIADLVDVVRPGGPEARRVHASRWVTLRAAVFDGTHEELLRALARNVDFAPDHVVDAFGVEAPLVHRVLGDRPYTNAHREEAIERIAADAELRGSIVAAAGDLRARLLRYLDSVLSPTDGRLVICDIGWGGTIQEGLEQILRHDGRLGVDDDLVGLYLSLSDAGIRRVGRGARMIPYLPSDPDHERPRAALQRTPEILEQLCTPNAGTMLDVDGAGIPVIAPIDPTWTDSRSRAQVATRRMVERLARVERDLPSRPPIGDAADADAVDGWAWSAAAIRSALLRGLATTLESPTPRLADALTGWLHDDVAGGTVVPLARPADLTFLPFLGAAEIDTVSMRDVFWLAGAAAAANPPLAAQLTAASRGVDVDALCPPSEAGRATVAVYEPGADDAVAVDHPVPRLDARGWSLLRLSTATEAIRDIRVDFGNVDHLVELDHLTIHFHRDAGTERSTSTWEISRLDDRRLRWFGARAIGPTRRAVRAGGHLVVPVTGLPEAASNLVEIECAFRVSAIRSSEASAMLPSPSVEQARQLTRRVGAGLLRRARAVASRDSTATATTATTQAPTFSIVLPIYESPLTHLEEQLRAIADQTYSGWECIVVDDGSLDERPRELARSHADADARFEVHVRESNGGIAAATNEAIERAGHDWIVFVDHDDVIHPDALARIADHIGSNPTDDIVYTDEQTIDSSGAPTGEYRKPDFSPQRLLGHNYFCHIVAMRRSLVEQVGRLDAAYEPSADREFNIRAADSARGVGHVPEILYSWRAIPGSVATSSAEKPNVGRSVVASTVDALRRRGDDGVVAGVPADDSSVSIRRPRPEATVDRVRLTPTTAPGEVHDLLRTSAADVVFLEPPVGTVYEPADIDQLVALSLLPTGSVVGPRLIGDDGRLVSAGRVHAPAYGDLFRGIDADNPGPWGAFLVTREVSSISPIGAVLDRRAVLDVGGFDVHALFDAIDAGEGETALLDRASASLDLTMAVLCTVMRLSGRPALWCPSATLEVPASGLLDEHARSRLADEHRALTTIWPPLGDEPFSPTGVRRSC